MAVCGSTSDPNGIGSPPNSLQGPTDGFVLTFFDDTRIVGAPGLVGGAGRFYGGPGDDGLTGIQCWNEYADHAVGCGFTQGAGSSTTDIGVESYFVNAVGPELVERIRSGTIGGTANERPAAMGALNATGPTAPLPFATGPLGDSAGGGISVDERARVNVVGQTVGTDFPETLGARPHDSGFDAVRVVFDMLPLGVGRSDGTGDAGSFVLPATFSGGTTPLCALAPFGKLIGQPAPAVPRMLIDYRGPQPAAGVTGASIFVSRPTAPIVAGQWASSVVLAGFQFGFPGVAVPPLMLLEGVEMYTTDNPYIYVAGFGYSNQAHIELLAPLPTPPSLGLPMTVQMFFWVPSTVPGGVGPAPCPGVSEFTATPALWMPL